MDLLERIKAAMAAAEKEGNSLGETGIELLARMWMGAHLAVSGAVVDSHVAPPSEEQIPADPAPAADDGSKEDGA